MRKDGKTALHLTRLKENRKRMNEGGGRVTDDGTDCVPSPQPQTRKEGVKRENKREKGREPNLIYLCMSILGLLWHSRFLSPTESTSQMFYHLLYTCPVGQSRITGSFQTVFRFLTVQYFSVWLQVSKTHLMLSSVSE